MSFRASFLAIAFLLMLAGCKDQVAVEVSTRDCGMNGEPYCRVSFQTLAENAGSYDGKMVRVEGYLAVFHRFFALNRSRELLEAGVTDEQAIRIRGAIDLQRHMFEKHAYSWVSVVGVFRLREANGTTDDLLVGELHAPLDIRSLGGPVSQRKESFGEVAIELEDLK